MDNKAKNEEKNKDPKENILSVVKQFISYFEEIDRSEANDHSVKHS